MRRLLLILFVFAFSFGYGQNLHYPPFNPVGGSANQVITKNSSTNFDYSWNNVPVGFQPGYIDVTTYGAKGDLIELYDGAITSGSSTFTSTSASFGSGDVGKSIYIGGAGASGARLITTITGFTNSHTVTIGTTAGSTVSSMDFKYGTDNTPLIQNAINAGFAAGRSPVIFFNTVYGNRYGLFAAPQTSVNGVNPNCQIYIPLSPYTASDTMHAVTLMGNGEGNYYIDFASGQKYPFAGIFLESMRMDTAASVIGSPWGSYVYGLWNYTHLHLINIGVIVGSRNGNTDIKPMMTAIRARNIAFASIENVIVRTESPTLQSVKPDSACVGYETPQFNNGGNNSIDNFLALGFHDGIIVNENTNGDNIIVGGCFNGLTFLKGNHAAYFGRVLGVWNANHVTLAAGGASYPVIDQLDLEDFTTATATTWFDNLFDLNDVNGSTSQGNIQYQRVIAGSSVSNLTFTRSGNGLTSGVNVRPLGYSLPYVKSSSLDILKLGTSTNSYLQASLDGPTSVGFLFSKNNVGQWSIQKDYDAVGRDNISINNYALGKTIFWSDSTGRIGLFDNHAPSAWLDLSVGSATAGKAPIKFHSAPITTTPEIGAMQFQNGLWFIDSSNSVRDTIAGRKWVQSVITGATAGVTSLGSTASSLTFSPTTGAVLGDINLAHTNTFTAIQHFNGLADITNNQNAGTTLNLSNNSAGTGSYTQFGLGNGTNTGTFALYGTGTSTFGLFTAGTVYMYGDAAAGMAFDAHNGSASMRFGINGIEAMRIAPTSRNVLIGTPTDGTGKLQVNGTATVTALNATTYVQGNGSSTLPAFSAVAQTTPSGLTDGWIWNDVSTHHLKSYLNGTTYQLDRQTLDMVTSAGASTTNSITTGSITLGTAGNSFNITEGTNGRVGQTVLVAGTKAITISGLTTSSRAFVQLVSQGGTVTTTVAYEAVCTSNTLTINAVTNAGSNALNNLDTSTINYFIIN